MLYNVKVCVEKSKREDTQLFIVWKFVFGGTPPTTTTPTSNEI